MRFWQKGLFVLAVFGLGVVSLLTSPGRGDSRMSNAARHGRELFLERCAACHNETRKVGPPLVTNFNYLIRAGVPERVLGGMVLHSVRNRPPGDIMPTFTAKDLSDTDVADIVHYLSTQTKAPKTPPAMGNAENGKPVYLANCARCHGENGEGKQGGKAPALAAIAHYLKGKEAPPNMMLGLVTLATRSGTLKHMPTFPAEKISDGQLADIAAYIWSLPPPSTPPEEAHAHH